MKAIIYVLAAALALLGLVFIVGAQGQVLRIVVGIVLLVAAAGLVWLQRVRPTTTTVVHKVDLSGDVRPEQLDCKSCGAHLSSRSVQVRAGAVFVECEFCGAAYQIEEQPKW
jgi:hypothetical protein